MSQSVAQLQRKVKKPLIEKKRRERINKCLRELKKLVLDGTDADSSRLSAKLEKAEILEMTVAYVSQLRGAKCSLSSDVTAGARRRRTHGRVLDDLPACDSSSAEYRAGFSECLLHVQRFLADQATGADVRSDVPLPQLLMDHLRQFVASARPPTDGDGVIRSLPSPDTTLGTLPAVDANPLPLPSTSPAVVARRIVPRSSALAAGQTSPSLGRRHPPPAFLLPPSDALRRNQLVDDGRMIRQSPTSDGELQRRLQSGVFVVPPAIIQPSSAASFLLFSPLISTSASSDRSSPTSANDAATCLQPASPGDDADHDVWRPWRPETSTCSQCSDVSDSSSRL